MLAGIRARIATRRTRRHRAAVVASAGAALLIAAVPIVVNQLDLTGDDDAARSVGTSSATESPGSTGPAPTTAPTAESLDPAEVAFTVPTLPAGYRPVTVTTTVGEQTRAYTNFPESPQVPIDVTLFDPQVNGGPTPTASAETVQLNSATAGPIAAYVGRGAGAADEGESIDVYWEVEDGQWV